MLSIEICDSYHISSFLKGTTHLTLLLVLLFIVVSMFYDFAGCYHYATEHNSLMCCNGFTLLYA